MNIEELSDLPPEERLHIENEVLKIRLQTEFGMKDLNSSLNPSAENDWLNYIHNYEKQFAEHKRCKVSDLIGQFEFKKIEELDPSEYSFELDRIMKIMSSKGIQLGMLCDYEDETIYRFITEELFEEETDDIRIEGMMHCFTYEDFHPNHDYDIRKQADEFIEFLIVKKWDKYLDNILLASTIIYSEKQYDPKTFPPIVHAFQSENSLLELVKWEINHVSFDLMTYKASLEGFIRYNSKDSNQTFDGKVCLDFILEYELWSVSSIILPGFSSE